MAGLDTQRLKLQPLGAAHLEALHSLSVDPDVRRYLFKDRVIPLSQVEEMLVASDALFAEMGTGFFAVYLNLPEHPNDQDFIGFCGQRHFEGGSEIELLLGMNPDIWGRGFGAEAARAVLAHGFACGLQRVIAAADTPNQRSIKVLQKLGMS